MLVIKQNSLADILTLIFNMNMSTISQRKKSL